MFSSSKRIKGSITKTKGLGGSAIYKSEISVEEAYNQTCLDFGGTDEYASRADAAAHDFTTAFTVSAWVKGAATADYAGIVVKGDYGTPANGFVLQRSGAVAGKFGFLVCQDGATQYKFWSSSITAFDNTWHHICGVFGSSTLKLYVDGVLDSSPTKTIDEPVSTMFNNSVGLRLGSQLNSGTPANFYTGKLCSVSLWSKALSQAEITELYNDGLTTDVSTHSAYAASCVSWYKAGDGDSNAANGIVDTKGGLHLTPTNMEAGDIGFADAP